MRFIIFLTITLIAINSYGTSNTLEKMLEDEEHTDIELYSWLQIKGMRDKTVSNREIHKLITDGLRSEDPEIQHCTITAIQFHVGTNVNLIIENKTVIIDRRLQDIPGLYDLLMKMWDEGVTKSGGVVPEIDFDITSEQLEKGFPCLAGRPGWAGLPRTLAYLYPKNKKVYDIVWNALKDKKILSDHEEDNPIPLLSALYVGEFNNPRDEAFRIQVLTNPETQNYDAALAAISLAKFQSEKGLAALVSTLEKNDNLWGLPYLEIVEAVIAHGEEATTKHQTLLRKALSKALITSKDKTRASLIDKQLATLEDESEQSDVPTR
ncbi:MAG: hypothetical protein F4039_08745 [Gammaproteobacteria bacterium]|nr:hypothetical protein [Gammaproteobacteria bacterium]